MKNNLFSILFLLTAVFAFATGCATGPEVIPEDASVAELIQYAQTSIDDGKPGKAKEYLYTVLERYPDDMEAVCCAEYELAHIEVKAKNWKKAEELLTNLLDRYEADTEETLPRAYRILAENDLKKIK